MVMDYNSSHALTHRFRSEAEFVRALETMVKHVRTRGWIQSERRGARRCAGLDGTGEERRVRVSDQSLRTPQTSQRKLDAPSGLFGHPERLTRQYRNLDVSEIFENAAALSIGGALKIDALDLRLGRWSSNDDEARRPSGRSRRSSSPRSKPRERGRSQLRCRRWRTPSLRPQNIVERGGVERDRRDQVVRAIDVEPNFTPLPKSAKVESPLVPSFRSSTDVDTSQFV